MEPVRDANLSVLATRNPEILCQDKGSLESNVIFVTCTISEDRSGDLNSVMATRLAALNNSKAILPVRSVAATGAKPLPDGVLAEEEAEVSAHTVKCVCGYDGDDGTTVCCVACETWQHRICYYSVFDGLGKGKSHYCVDCQPRPIDIDIVPSIRELPDREARETSIGYEEPDGDERDSTLKELDISIKSIRTYYRKAGEVRRVIRKTEHERQELLAPPQLKHYNLALKMLS